MRPLPAPPVTLARAVLAAAVASLRLAWWMRRLPLDRVAARLRRGRPFRGRMADPELHRRVVGRLTRVLPPPRVGACLKRSLLLLHLWSRCGLTPTLHIGTRRQGGHRAFHAWLTTPEGPALPHGEDGAPPFEELLAI